MRSRGEALLGYHAVLPGAEDGALVAGILVTNGYSIPIEFRYTDPVDGSEHQRLLYADGDFEDARASAMAASLWRALETRPSLLLVEDLAAHRFWHHLSSTGDTVVAHIEPTAEDLIEVAGVPRTLVSLDPRGKSRGEIRVFAEEPSSHERAMNVVSAAARNMAVDEPFARVEAILKAIHDLPSDRTRRRSSPAPNTAPAPKQIDPAGAGPLSSAGDAATGEEASPSAVLEAVEHSSCKVDIPDPARTPASASASEVGSRGPADTKSAGGRSTPPNGLNRRPDLQWMLSKTKD